MIYVRASPTNPTMIVTDLAAISGLARARNLTLTVVNPFLSPYLQQPIPLGAHIVIHSMTKYLNSHSDCTGGAVDFLRGQRTPVNLLPPAFGRCWPRPHGLLFGFPRY